MIQSVELHAVIQRSQDVTQIKANEDAKPQDDHNAIVMHQHKNETVRHEQVNKKDNADKEQKKYDAKEGGNGTYYNQNQGRKKKKDDEDGVIIKKGNTGFDVKI